MTPRIPPKNGFVFTPGNVIRLEFPAQGYVNPMTTTLEFDVSLTVPNPELNIGFGSIFGQGAVVRFQNNIQSIFSRVRLLYGANPLEDIINYNVIVRNLTEWTAGNPSLCVDQGTITDGIGNNTIGFGWGVSANESNSPGITPCLLNTRANLIQGCASASPLQISQIYGGGGRGTIGATVDFPQGVFNTGPVAWKNTANTQSDIPMIVVTRRYQVQLALGLMTQEKLIPTKYMASQLAIELSNTRFF